ncbi:MAG: chloride channel protein [Pseudomonadales bacterium]
MALKLFKGASLDFFRGKLAGVDALPQLALLATVTGLITGCVILVFRYLIEQGFAGLFMDGNYEAFEQLPELRRLAMALSGALIIGLLMNRLRPRDRRVGVVHVMERLSRHQGYMPFKNTLIQFFGGVLALASGQSGGREGPSIHLGAAAASALGQTFQLPNNSLRTLIACGTAAAIASSFNTPMAGVIFAMEVVMMEYTITSFIPVIIAAVTSTLLTHSVMGSEPAFTIAPLHMESLLETPFIVFAGMVIGTVAAGYIALVQRFASLSHWPFWIRALLAGAITGTLALGIPEIMGIGYDTVSAAMLGQLGLTALFLIVVAKILSSAAASGLGLPVGMIGPTLMIGACVGAVMAHLGRLFEPGTMSSDGFYVMLGMSAMMAAVLQAPLAALVSVLELTANPNVILPAMLIIVVATMMTSEVFKSKGVFLRTLGTLGLEYPPSPITQHMQRVGVTALMDRSFTRLAIDTDRTGCTAALQGSPRWILCEDTDGNIRSLLDASDLQAHLEDPDADSNRKSGPAEDPSAEPVNLLQIPGMRRDIADVDDRATLHQAQEALQQSGAEAICVRRHTAPLIRPIIGVITQTQINNYRELA